MRPHRLGRPRLRRGRLARASNCSTTSTTCKSWRAISSPPSRENPKWLGHFHTGGVPGRHELDDTQEVNWAAVMRGIAATGFTGYVAHEFVPTRDPLTSLREAVDICDI